MDIREFDSTVGIVAGFRDSGMAFSYALLIVLCLGGSFHGLRMWIAA